jgi:hypothetical protein
MATPKRSSAKRSAKKPAKKRETPTIPRRIFANVSPRSLGGVSLFEAGPQITASTVPNFFSEPEVINRAAVRLQEAGFEILQITQSTINIAGSASLYNQAFNTTIVAEERPVIKPQEGETTATFLDTRETEIPGLIRTTGTAFEDLIEGVALEEPRYFMAPSAFPPLKEYWHLDVPAGVSLGCNADRAHRSGITGLGIKVAMVDSGWYKHPFFVRRGYRAAPVVLGPAAANPLKDESGHGTGESANIFSVAPDVELLPVKINFVNSKGAFDAAVGLGPDIITCSWGSSKQFGPLSAADQALAASIATAVASGIIVIFSAGNGHWGFPGQHPDVISAGGVFMDVDESLRASDYASGFMSNIYANRRVPDLSGLVGMQPGASYIMLPLEPNDDIDQIKAGGTHPPGDETADDDGWAAFSGTSAAAPQLAGAAALIKQACPRLSPVEVRAMLMKGAVDVTAGQCHPNTGANPAVVGPDLATGNGLVDAHKSVMLARLRCLGPIGPIRPISIQPPIQPITVQPPILPPIQPPIQPPILPPIQPPIQPIQPISPVQPILPPIQPVQPIRPIQPILPPIQPVQPIGPAGPEMASDAARSASPTLSQREVEMLEDMVLNSDLNIDDLGGD